MKSSLRPTSINDLGPLTQFLARAFAAPPTAPFLDPAGMAWKYWDPRDDWTGPRSLVLEKEGAIVAHAGLWPMIFRSGEAEVRGVHMIDWASAKESPGAGLTTVQKLGSMFDFIFSIGGTEMTRQVLPAFGFVEYNWGWRGVRPLRPLRQALTHQTRNWKLAPRLIRNLLWSASGGENPHRNWTPREIAPSSLGQDSYQPHIEHAISSPRAPAFFEYLSRCPIAPMKLYGIFEDRELKGHFVMFLVRGQARIAGVWLKESSREAWASAYFLAQRAALQWKGANEIVATGSDGPSKEGAELAGLKVAKGAPVYILDKKKKLSLAPHFQFQLIEDDEAFLDTGAASYWS